MHRTRTFYRAAGVVGLIILGASLGAQSKNPADLAGTQPLNTLVTELARTTLALKSSATGECRFRNPRDGWIFIAVTPGSGADGINVALSGISNNALIKQAEGQTATMEAMRWIPAGEYRLGLAAKQDTSVEIIVRAVPELLFDAPSYGPGLGSPETYDWIFLEKHVLPACNAFIRGKLSPAEYEKASARGMRWFDNAMVPGATSGGWTDNADEIAAYWASRPGFTNSQYNGITADEFLPWANYPVYAHAVDKLYCSVPPDRLFYPFIADMPLFGGCSRVFIGNLLATVFNKGGKAIFEAYCLPKPTQAKADKYLDFFLLGTIKRYRNCIPEAQSNMVYALGYLTDMLVESQDHYPQVDFKYYLDMQLNLIANRPEFQGLYGLCMYSSGYADEETVRWTWRLLRHYAIEGRREMLSGKYGFNYLPGHLVNCDFERGTRDWNVMAAEKDAVGAGAFQNYGKIEARWSVPRGVGDTFLVMRRSAKKENRVSQSVKNLVPGKLYSLKFVVADLAGLKAGKSPPVQYEAHATLDNVQVVPGKSSVYVNKSRHCNVAPFDRAQNPFCANLHRIVFRANSQTSTLTFSDWASDKEPGGPAGQELIINFVQMKPYFEEE